jgi:hypothetical protein
MSKPRDYPRRSVFTRVAEGEHSISITKTGSGTPRRSTCAPWTTTRISIYAQREHERSIWLPSFGIRSALAAPPGPVSRCLAAGMRFQPERANGGCHDYNHRERCDTERSSHQSVELRDVCEPGRPSPRDGLGSGGSSLAVSAAESHRPSAARREPRQRYAESGRGLRVPRSQQHVGYHAAGANHCRIDCGGRLHHVA